MAKQIIIDNENKSIDVNVTARSDITLEISRSVSATGVQQIVAGNNITISPVGGTGVVTVNSITVNNVANANYANFAGTAYSVSGANVSGSVAQANLANTANSVAVANVSGIGNIATINLDGLDTTVLYGNGVFTTLTLPSGSGISNGASNVTIPTANGNVVVNAGGDGYGLWIFEATTGNLVGPGNSSQGAGITFSATQNVYIREDMGGLTLNSNADINVNTPNLVANANIVASSFSGNGSALSSITGANV